MVVFVTEFVTFLKTSKYIELEENGFGTEKFQKYFSRPFFNIMFRPKIVTVGTDSILRIKTMYEPVE